MPQTADHSSAQTAVRRGPLKKKSSGRFMIFGFLSPTLMILLFMVAYPIFSLIWYSFHNFSALRPNQGFEYIGLEN